MYAPVSSYGDDEKEEFQVTHSKSLITCHKIKLAVMGDFNGKKGKEGRTNWENLGHV